MPARARWRSVPGMQDLAIVCKDLGDLFAGVRSRRVSDYEAGVFPTARGWHYSMACNHCEKPACVASCPTGAMHQSEDGTILHDDNACIGCQRYVLTARMACLSIAPCHCTECDVCAQRLAGGKNPVCVGACAMRVLGFGDLGELSQKSEEGLVNALSFLPSASITNPAILAKPRRRRSRKTGAKRGNRRSGKRGSQSARCDPPPSVRGVLGEGAACTIELLAEVDSMEEGGER